MEDGEIHIATNLRSIDSPYDLEFPEIQNYLSMQETIEKGGAEVYLDIYQSGKNESEVDALALSGSTTNHLG